MNMIAECFGPLIWWDVPADEHGPASAIIECAVCPFIIVSSNILDDRHARTDVVMGSNP